MAQRTACGNSDGHYEILFVSGLCERVFVIVGGLCLCMMEEWQVGGCHAATHRNTTCTDTDGKDLNLVMEA